MDNDKESNRDSKVGKGEKTKIIAKKEDKRNRENI